MVAPLMVRNADPAQDVAAASLFSDLANFFPSMSALASTVARWEAGTGPGEVLGLYATCAVRDVIMRNLEALVALKAILITLSAAMTRCRPRLCSQQSQRMSCSIWPEGFATGMVSIRTS